MNYGGVVVLYYYSFGIQNKAEAVRMQNEGKGRNGDDNIMYGDSDFSGWKSAGVFSEHCCHLLSKTKYLLGGHVSEKKSSF